MDPALAEATMNASYGAVAAITYVMRPEVWPGFAAWAEQELPDTTWTEEDRRGFEPVLKFFVIVAKGLDQ
jgi:hypothetical protein